MSMLSIDSSSSLKVSKSNPVFMVSWLCTFIYARRCSSVNLSSLMTGTVSMPSSSHAMSLPWPSMISLFFHTAIGSFIPNCLMLSAICSTCC